MKNQALPSAVEKSYVLVRQWRITALLLMGLILGQMAGAQSFIGYGYDNYSGVNSIILNPGMLAGSKYKVNVNIVSVSAFAGNNAYELDRKNLFKLKFSHLSEGDGYYKATNKEYKYVYLNTDILGPSAMFTIDKKDAIGIITRVRSIGNIFNLSDPLFRLMGTADPAYFNSDIINRSLQVKSMSFAEVGLSFGRILKQNSHMVLKAGITGKYISGIAYGSLSTGQMTVNLDPSNTIFKMQADVNARYSSNMDDLGGGASIKDALTKHNGKGWGADLGLVYEWRPDPFSYKLRLGLSLTDLGAVNFTNSPNGKVYTMTADGHNAKELQVKDGETFNQYFTRLQDSGLVTSKGGVEKINAKLPTALHLNADYNIYKRLYINADILFNTVANTNQVTPNYITTFTITPRLEKKWFSIYSPVSYNVQKQLAWGAGARIGPLFVGSGSVLSSLFKNRIQHADVHIGLTIPIFQQNKKKDEEKKNKKDNKADTLYKKIIITHDRDSDGVVDEKDACPDSAGPIQLLGCPDDDGDGVPNNKDKCPGVKGSPNFEGCPAPDSDGDGVNDDEDKCPDVKGSKANHGCPAIKADLIMKVNRAADRIFFKRAKSNIEKICLPELDRVAAILKADTSLRLVIQGHTDSEGTEQRNAALSVRRAKAVKEYMMSQGVAENRLETHAYGANRPIASNETAEGMAQNRRVDMELRNWQKK
ncbi:MAG: OmpA family protein [Chitinophagaceae bacterium]|nr:OmpA family protein [Chitinophagaceae bacterium]